MIEITVNGETERLDGPVPLPDLVRRVTESDELEGIAVGLNQEVVPRDEWDGHEVNEGDEVEIIAPFAGG